MTTENYIIKKYPNSYKEIFEKFSLRELLEVHKYKRKIGRLKTPINYGILLNGVRGVNVIFEKNDLFMFIRHKEIDSNGIWTGDFLVDMFVDLSKENIKIDGFFMQHHMISIKRKNIMELD